MFSHLDYSFTVDHPDGTASVAGTSTPGYGGADLRAQLGFLRRFLEDAEVWNMRPMAELITWNLPPKIGVQVMGNPQTGRYVGWWSLDDGADALRLSLPAGNYTLRRADPVGPTFLPMETLTHGGGYLAVSAGDVRGTEAAFLLERIS